MKKIRRDQKVDFRLSAKEKIRLREYAEAHNMSVGEVVRAALNRMFAFEEKEEEE